MNSGRQAVKSEIKTMIDKECKRPIGQMRKKPKKGEALGQKAQLANLGLRGRGGSRGELGQHG